MTPPSTVSHTLLTCTAQDGTSPDAILRVVVPTATAKPQYEWAFPGSGGKIAPLALAADGAFTRENGGILSGVEGALTLTLVAGVGFDATLKSARVPGGEARWRCVTPDEGDLTVALAPFAADDEAARLSLARAVVVAWEGMPLHGDEGDMARHLAVGDVSWETSPAEGKLMVDYTQGRWFGSAILSLAIRKGRVTGVTSHEFSGSF